MMWDEAQARLARERRATLAAHYRAAVDAGLQVIVSAGQAKPRGTWRQPPYIEAVAPDVVRTPASRDRALAKLGVMFPGIVVRPS